MLWSDPENKPPKELRDTQEMLRRLGVLMALAMVLAMLVIGVRCAAPPTPRPGVRDARRAVPRTPIR
jgi:hypothetical protein